jgi:hypothetical protein
MVIESPLPASLVEGISFFVGAYGQERPCIFANSHCSTWFRRNHVLFHELAHAVFDAQQSGAVLDFASGANEMHEISEPRAQAFAQECLLPFSVLRHAAQIFGIDWNQLKAADLARLVAETHAEQKLVLSVAQDAGFIGPDRRAEYSYLDIGRELKELTKHALTTKEWVRAEGETARRISGKRTTTVPERPLMLPIPYINTVLEACKNAEISTGRAAELLMIDRVDFESRFGSELEPLSEPA